MAYSQHAAISTSHQQQQRIQLRRWKSYSAVQLLTCIAAAIVFFASLCKGSDGVEDSTPSLPYFIQGCVVMCKSQWWLEETGFATEEECSRTACKGVSQSFLRRGAASKLNQGTEDIPPLRVFMGKCNDMCAKQWFRSDLIFQSESHCRLNICSFNDATPNIDTKHKEGVPLKGSENVLERRRRMKARREGIKFKKQREALPEQPPPIVEAQLSASEQRKQQQEAKAARQHQLTLQREAEAKRKTLLHEEAVKKKRIAASETQHLASEAEARKQQELKLQKQAEFEELKKFHKEETRKRKLQAQADQIKKKEALEAKRVDLKIKEEAVAKVKNFAALREQWLKQPALFKQQRQQQQHYQHQQQQQQQRQQQTQLQHNQHPGNSDAHEASAILEQTVAVAELGCKKGADSCVNPESLQTDIASQHQEKQGKLTTLPPPKSVLKEMFIKINELSQAKQQSDLERMRAVKTGTAINPTKVDRGSPEFVQQVATTLEALDEKQQRRSLEISKQEDKELIPLKIALAQQQHQQQQQQHQIPDAPQIEDTKPLCHGHSECTDGEFCTLYNQCFRRSLCKFAMTNPEQHPIDGQCPPRIKTTAAGHPKASKHKNTRKAKVHRAVATVQVCAGDCISAIAFKYYDGSVFTWGNESVGCAQKSSFAIPKGHYLAKIRTRTGDTLSGLQLITNKGTASDWFGQWTGHHSQFKARSGSEIWALERSGVQTCSPLDRIHERIVR